LRVFVVQVACGAALDDAFAAGLPVVARPAAARPGGPVEARLDGPR
jgi:hypothetical protein